MLTIFLKRRSSSTFRSLWTPDTFDTAAGFSALSEGADWITGASEPLGEETVGALGTVEALGTIDALGTVEALGAAEAFLPISSFSEGNTGQQFQMFSARTSIFACVPGLSS